jgi:hypothetical protein
LQENTITYIDTAKQTINEFLTIKKCESHIPRKIKDGITTKMENY